MLCSSCSTRHHTAVLCCALCHAHCASPCSTTRCLRYALPCSAVHCLYHAPLCVRHPLHHPAPGTACTVRCLQHCAVLCVVCCLHYSLPAVTASALHRAHICSATNCPAPQCSTCSVQSLGRATWLQGSCRLQWGW